ncbi:MAG: MDR family MFS transporter [Acidimicrobiia bacterium]
MTEISDVVPEPFEAGPKPVDPWLAAVPVIAGIVLVTLDTTIVNVALRDIGHDLGVGTSIAWVATAYFLGTCGSQPVAGWLAGRLGQKGVFLTAFIGFCLASVGCAASPNLGALVAMRVVQGSAGGVMAPVGMAMMLSLFPREMHGRAMGIASMALMLTPAVGPTAGGLIVDNVSWHWLFLVNVPIGALAIVAGRRLIPVVGVRSDRAFDGVGLLLGSGGLSLAALGLMQGNDWGWTSTATVTSLAIGVAALAAFVAYELKIPHPLVELRMLSLSNFRSALIIMMLVAMAQFGRLVFVPLALESLRGYSALEAGALLAPGALVGMAASFASGRLIERVGPRLPIVAGCVLSLVGTLGLTRLQLDTPVFVVGAILSVQSAGMGLVIAPAMVAGISELPAHLIPQGTGMRSLGGQVSGALAVAILGAVVSTRMGVDPTPAHAQATYNSAFYAAALGVVIALVLALRMPPQVSRHDDGPMLLSPE